MIFEVVGTGGGPLGPMPDGTTEPTYQSVHDGPYRNASSAASVYGNYRARSPAMTTSDLSASKAIRDRIA